MIARTGLRLAAVNTIHPPIGVRHARDVPSTSVRQGASVCRPVLACRLQFFGALEGSMMRQTRTIRAMVGAAIVATLCGPQLAGAQSWTALSRIESGTSLQVRTTEAID